jgi:Pro-kumamolisin, activation domain
MSVRLSSWRLKLTAGVVAAGLVSAGLAAGSLLTATSAVAAQAQHGPPVVAQAPLPVRNGSAHEIGPVNPAQAIRLSIGLRPPNMAAEQQFLREIQTKSSPLFHQYLTLAQWTARFGPSAAAQNSVVSWARGAGLTVTHLYPNRLVVDVAGSAGAIEKALGVQINTYRLGAQTFFANDRDPVLAPALTGIVQSVDGLSDLPTMSPASGGLHEPASSAYKPGPVFAAGPRATANGSQAKLRAAEKASGGRVPNITNGAYDPTDIYSSQAYDYSALYAQGHCCNPLGNSGSSPVQDSIAIATFGSQAVSDMQGFQSQYPYLAYNFQEEWIDGTPPGGDGEGTMDLEWSTAMSNSFGSFADTAKVYLYDAATNNDATWTDLYNSMVSGNLARVFSTSWGCAEVYGCSTSTADTQDAIFSEMAGQGWTLVAASGDHGGFADCSHVGVMFPSSDPNVVAAGGAELSLSAGPVYNFEVGWSPGPDGCGSNDGGSTGGCSALFAAPPYQTNQPCGSGSRAVPDLALNADWFDTPQNIYFGGGLSGNGGTSIVAPELAGFFAQEDAYLLYEGNICGSGSSPCAPFGDANYPIYATALHGAPHDPFYDITSGCNGVYCAGTGWDAVTGWGSANMLQLAWAFNWRLLADDGRPGVAFSGPAPGVWYHTDQTVGITVADTGGGRPPSGVAGFSDAWNVNPGDPVTEPTPGGGNSFYNGPEFKNATSGTLDLAAEGQGCHTVNVQSWDNMGFQSGDVTDGPLCYDSVPPVITKAPGVALRGNAGIGSTVPVTVSWSGTDATSGVNHFTLYQSRDGGAYAQVATTAGTSDVLHLAPGHTYRYEVTGTDNAGNTSAVRAGSVYTLSLLQENSGAIKYSTGWKRQALAGASGGHVDYATAAGKTATFSFTGIQVAWVSTLGTTRGSASVKLGSGGTAIVSTHASSTKTAQIVSVISAPSGSHKLVITVLGTSGHPRVDIDAFIVLAG